MQMGKEKRLRLIQINQKLLRNLAADKRDDS
jgi:hypothetical protein